MKYRPYILSMYLLLFSGYVNKCAIPVCVCVCVKY